MLNSCRDSFSGWMLPMEAQPFKNNSNIAIILSDNSLQALNLTMIQQPPFDEQISESQSAFCPESFISNLLQSVASLNPIDNESAQRPTDGSAY